jgi:hypothetical protein
VLIVGGEELNPEQQTEKKLLEYLTEQREDTRARRWCLEKNKSSVDTIGVKLNAVNETIKILMEEQGGKKGRITFLEAKPRVAESKGNIMDVWRRRNNVVMPGIEERP